MRRFYLYAVVGLFASLLWAGAVQSTAQAASAYAPTTNTPVVVAPVQNFAEIFEWESLNCEPEDPAIDIDLSLTDPEFDINGSSIITEYIVCPLVEGMYTGVGIIVNALEATGLLEIPALLTNGQVSSDSQKGLFAVWGVMRDLANVGLVIGLFVVIFSQATSYGLSAYGVKKMLPKVVVAALLVNLSYITCAILVDVFNILGSSLDDLIKGALDRALVDITIADMIAEASTAVGAALAIGGGLGILVMAFMFLIIFFILICFGLVAVVFLVARQILVICLIVAAPLAFISWLFPNTESNFRKWWNTLIKLLAIYPIVMCLKIVSYVIIIVMAGLIGINS